MSNSNLQGYTLLSLCMVEHAFFRSSCMIVHSLLDADRTIINIVMNNV